MKTKFTKGPWVAVDRGAWFEIDSADGENVANSGGFDPDHTGFNFCDELAANSHLIAAAPEMYELLEKQSELMDFLDEQTHPNIELDAVKHEIDKLLAKARGEQ